MSNLVKQLKKAGYKDGFTKIALAFDSTLPDQVFYEATLATNEYLSNNFGINVSFFVMHNLYKIIQPKFAIFNILNVRAFDGSVVACTPKILKNSLNCYVADVYGYATDKKWLDQYDPRFAKVPIIARSKDYVAPLKETGYNVVAVMEYVDIPALHKILKEHRNAEKG